MARQEVATIGCRHSVTDGALDGRRQLCMPLGCKANCRACDTERAGWTAHCKYPPVPAKAMSAARPGMPGRASPMSALPLEPTQLLAWSPLRQYVGMRTAKSSVSHGQ
eukprot:4471132-Amphidinium_carterae.1